MARLNATDGRIRDLVKDWVAPLFLVHTSVLGVTKALNEALAADGREPSIHPNRVHTLLSDDVARGLNDSTLEVLERAARLAWPIGTRSDEVTEKREKLKAAIARLRFAGMTDLEELSAALSLPRGIARTVIAGDDGKSLSASDRHAAHNEISAGAPDWSYQDVAVSRCLDALARRPGGRIGLVLPTGAGKTRTALRISLTTLARHVDPNAVVIWLTHRKNLRAQAYRELQKMIAARQAETLLADPLTLSGRIRFVMVGDSALAESLVSTSIALVVIDEAHHAAASSYQKVLEALPTTPFLMLTATPNRGDDLPLGIDEIAYTTTYRELAERGAILRPAFLDFPVEDFDWSEDSIDKLADYVIVRSREQFMKILVLAPRVERVESFHAALAARLEEEHSHPLVADDIGYVHGGGNSLDLDNEDFLARFAAKPRAILISAQILLEGFDDPSVDTVVLTYPTSSVIRLMQAAGRCVRFSPGKRKAYVVQARNSDIAYHFDHRWLYQDIDDSLRPDLRDYEYGNKEALEQQVVQSLSEHNVSAAAGDRVLARIKQIQPGETCRLFFYGLPYFGDPASFDKNARWGVVLEEATNGSMVRSLFNGFCALGADPPDPTDFLNRESSRFGLVKDTSAGSDWRDLSGLLTSAHIAKREMTAPSEVHVSDHRNYRASGPSTWLRYITFDFRPSIPANLLIFLSDCHNAAEIEATYLASPLTAAAAIKVPLPLAGSEAYLLQQDAWDELRLACQLLREQLAAGNPREQFGRIAAFVSSCSETKVPVRLLQHIEYLLSPLGWSERVLTVAVSSSIT